jgi:ParB-like chromosome segregation protein Spo0J
MSKDFSNLLGGALANKKVEEISMRERIVIREDFKALIPPLAKEEKEQLEENILKEGVRDPLVLWPVGESFILVDGHNRFSICQKHGLDFPFKVVEFRDDEEVSRWMVKNQLGRRNLSLEQQSYLRGLRYLHERSQNLAGQNVPRSKVDISEKLASEYNVSAKTIKRDAQFVEGVERLSEENPDLKKEILAGTSKITKQEVQDLAGSVKKKPKKKTKKKPKPLTAKEISRIAISYIQTETRSLEEVCGLLGEQSDKIRPIIFFSKWEESKGLDKSI